jgi:hypothetical protein
MAAVTFGGDRRRVWLAMLQFDGNFNRDFRGYS